MNETKHKAPTFNRTIKSTIFIMIFGDKKNLLELYNAVSGNHYTDPELLEVNTLENAIYMTVKNDISFVIEARLSLYEHQSTYNPNLPLRFLLYIASKYSEMTKNENLYGTKKVLIPPPQFVIFYNGQQEEPEQKILKLSDLYHRNSSADKNDAEAPGLELRALMLNINKGYNEKLKEACTALKEFLLKNRAEAKYMSIFEYDQEKHMKMEREQAFEEGWKAGEKSGRKAGEKTGEEKLLYLLIQKKCQKGLSMKEIAEVLETDEDTVKNLMEKHK